MTHILSPEGSAQTPVILTVPGLGNSGAGHWQTVWEDLLPNCHRVELGSWERPHRNSWVNKLDQAINAADGPVLLAAHSLGCHAVAWWAQLTCQGWNEKIQGALLVAPPSVGSDAIDERLSGFAPTPHILLPFPSIVVASHDDPYISFEQARALARIWGSRFADAGKVGHINAQSRLGAWPFGRFLLSRLAGGSEAQDPRQSFGNEDGPSASARLH